MNTLSGWIESIEKVIAMILIASMTIVIAAAVLFRYLLNAPIFWASEASIFMMAWLTFIGGSLGLKYKSQASVTFLVDRFSDNGKRVFEIVSYVIILIFMALLLYLSYQWVFSSSHQKSTSMRIPMWIPYLSVPVGLTFAFIHLLNNLVNLFKKKQQGGEPL
ncbi:TRAP transporter small permease [Psychrobacillus vulpis]|uniref:TRAP transporter small permease n=1 Tax=Psychrobacillus vulpis TaxID=2325572 RepID=A0A544TQ80_9BACI|nr:TRAP transporter small permease [Psychrobacillus vulpis]TQR19600.1 TRAP transporter small permease [Psychrobacillus vulpis]